MAESNPSAPRERLLIKVIMPRQGIERRVPGGGGPAKPFRPVDGNYRRRLSGQVSAIRTAILPQIAATGAAPVRVKLLAQAATKSHRPDQLFSAQSCPIVSGGGLGEIFIKATPQGLDQLASEIASNNSDQIVKELSCVEAIEPVTPQFRRAGRDPRDLLRLSPRRGRGFVTRVALFDFGPDDTQARLVSDFEQSCRTHGIEPRSSRGYAPTSFTYEVECRNEEDVETLSRVIGVRSVAPMARIKTLRPLMLNARTLPDLPSAEDYTGDFPVVVVVDTGIASGNPALDSWVVDRLPYVASPERNPDHGTFVAGLICWGHLLNPTIAGLDTNPCGVLDVQVIPNDDPAKGETSDLLESEFLESLEDALRQNANKYRVWNLSLGSDGVCSLDEFSSLAEELDNLQEKYQVSFVISAGNYENPPLLEYPRAPHQLAPGRITSPGDSVLGITVGSISHVDYRKSGPPRDHPSAFSRHGAGPNHVVKPDFVHYGGSCATDVSHISGIRSIHGNQTAENIGTSFAAPLVSRTLAQIYHQVTPSPSPVMARALLTHHARDPRDGGRVPDGDESVFGFGLPRPVPYCLECTPHSSTLVFEDILRPGYYLEWDDFPYPPSLKREGRYFGDISMTAVLAPARGGRWGNEYCESRIEAHLGVYRNQKSRATGAVSTKFVGLVPPEHRNAGLLHDAFPIEKLRQWAPVRTYYGHLGESGERGERWRLMVRLLTRHGVETQDAFRPQPFSLVVTIADPDNKVAVYDEVAQIIRFRYLTQNLTVRAAARPRTRQ